MEVCKFANVLKSKGVKKGDRVAVYMPMILEAVITLLACARIGAVHSIVVNSKNSTKHFQLYTTKYFPFFSLQDFPPIHFRKEFLIVKQRFWSLLMVFGEVKNF